MDSVAGFLWRIACLLVSSDGSGINEAPEILDSLIAFFGSQPADDFTEGDIPSSTMHGLFGKLGGSVPLMMGEKAETSLREHLGKHAHFVDIAKGGWDFSSALLVVGKVLISAYSHLELLTVFGPGKKESAHAQKEMATIWGGSRRTVGEAGVIHLYNNKSNEFAKEDLVKRLKETKETVAPVIEAVKNTPSEGTEKAVQK